MVMIVACIILHYTPPRLDPTLNKARKLPLLHKRINKQVPPRITTIIVEQGADDRHAREVVPEWAI